MNILLADNCELTKKSVSSLLRELFPECKIYTCNNWDEVEKEINSNIKNFELILLEIFMPSNKVWYEILEKVVRRYKYTPVCIITNTKEIIHIQKSFEAGAKGYLLKRDKIGIFKENIKKVYHGKLSYPEYIWKRSTYTKTKGSILTTREQEVLSLVDEGDANKAIAKKLNLTEHTVKRHIYNICDKLHAKNRVEAIKIARTRALISS